MIGEVNERQPLDRRLRDERRSEARAAGKRIESLRTRIDATASACEASTAAT